MQQNLEKSWDTDLQICYSVYSSIHEQNALHCGLDLLGAKWLYIALQCSLAAAGGCYMACTSLLNLIDSIR